MSLLGFLTGIGSLFAGNKDDTKTDSNSATSGVKNEIQNQTGKAKTVTNDKIASTGKTTTLGKTTGINNTDSNTWTTQGTTSNTQTMQSTNQSGTSNTQQTAAEKSKQAQTTTTYSSDVLASLDALLKTQLSSGNAEQATDAVAGRLQQVQADAAGPQFDVGNYVSGIAAAAGAATQSDLDSRINEILSATGTSETGNSMSALLGNRLRNEAAANLAGIVSNATAAGNQIKQQESANFTSQIDELTGNLSGQLNQLLGVAQGGRSETLGTGETASVQDAKTQDTAKQLTVGGEKSTVVTQAKETQAIRNKTAGTEEQTQNVVQLQNQQQTQDTTSSQTGLSATTANSNTTGTDSTKKGDIFSNLFDALSKSAAAA